MTKINQLIANWPKGTIKTVKELTQRGYYPQLLKVYSNSRWIQSFVRGMYKLYNDNVNWQGTLYGLQKNPQTTIHAGGKTALELRGYAHYLRPQANKIYLYSNKRENFNIWLAKFNQVILKRTEIFDYTIEENFTTYNAGNFEIKISAPELAALEMLYLVPKEQGFNEAFHLMEGLTSLRPNLVQALLERCTSIKVKRLFLFMSEKIGHDWFNKLNVERVGLGTGKRMVVRDGVLNKTYNITVPKAYEG